MTSIQLIAKCMKMIKDHKVCPETPLDKWPAILMFAHTRGYLYTNKDASAFAFAYCIPEWDEKYSEMMPEKESGNKGYVVFAVSESDDKLSILKMFRGFVRLHNLEEIYWYRRGNNSDLKKIRIKHEKQIA